MALIVGAAAVDAGLSLFSGAATAYLGKLALDEIFRPDHQANFFSVIEERNRQLVNDPSSKVHQVVNIWLGKEHQGIDMQLRTLDYKFRGFYDAEIFYLRSADDAPWKTIPKSHEDIEAFSRLCRQEGNQGLTCFYLVSAANEELSKAKYDELYKLIDSARNFSVTKYVAGAIATTLVFLRSAYNFVARR